MKGHSQAGMTNGSPHDYIKDNAMWAWVCKWLFSVFYSCFTQCPNFFGIEVKKNSDVVDSKWFGLLLFVWKSVSYI